MSNPSTPKVSVLLVTYNHEKYIREALDSLLVQETDFEFEIVVADDHSLDRTRAIIEGYRTENHNLRVLPSERNVGITRNYQRGFAACRGEYIAVLEGDDYWTSPTKLKTLVEFLETHQECAFCFHRFLRLVEGSTSSSVHPPVEITTEFALRTAAELAKGNFVGNFSACVYRREIINGLDPALFEMKVYDWMLNIMVAQEGMIGYIPVIMSVYRAHPAGVWSGKTPDEHRPELLELIDAYNKYLDFKFDSEFRFHKSALLGDVAQPMSGGSPSRSRRLWYRIKALVPVAVKDLVKNIYYRNGQSDRNRSN
jgi:glycosyltransferase involved in cell wall biosynthesis